MVILWATRREFDVGGLDEFSVPQFLTVKLLSLPRLINEETRGELN